ncbi:branched-chain amino acid ABC transporter permease [Geodermatophilus sp. URMC 64]
MSRTYYPAFIGCGLLIIGGLLALRSEQSASIMALTAVWALMACGWNIVSGYAGPLSLGQGAFFGLTAFSVSILFAEFNWSPYYGILAGVAASLVLAAVIGLTTLRLSGLYFGLATLTIPLILSTLTRYFGYHEIPRPFIGVSLGYFQFNSSVPYYIAAAILVAFALFFTAKLTTTRMGRYFVSIRENERAAEASGVPTFRYKFYAFMIGAVFSALAGGIYSQLAFVFDPNDVYSPLVSVQALLICLIGGPGTVLGPVIGAIIVIPGGELADTYFSQLPGLNNLAYAALLLIVAFLSRRGLYPFLADLFSALLRRLRPRERRSAKASEAAVPAESEESRAEEQELAIHRNSRANDGGL